MLAACSDWVLLCLYVVCLQEFTAGGLYKEVLLKELLTFVVSQHFYDLAATNLNSLCKKGILRAISSFYPSQLAWAENIILNLAIWKNFETPATYT